MPTEPIEGITWVLQQQVVDAVFGPVPEGVVVTLIMEGGSAGGNGGCNNYFASYVMETDHLDFGEIGSTQMACESPAGDVEAAYFENLDLVARWTSEGGSVTMLSADGAPLLYFVPRRSRPCPPT